MKQLILFFVLLRCCPAAGQELQDVLDSLQGQAPPVQVSIFQSPKLVLQQTPLVQKEHVLTFWIGHRFGDIGGEDGGIRTLFGLDGARDIHIALEYGLNENLSLGIGRSKFNETYSLQAKYALLQQQTQGAPLALSLFWQGSIITREAFLPGEFPQTSDRLTHFLQLISARRITKDISLMISPGYLLRSYVADAADAESFFTLGLGGRLKITRSLSLIGDYMLVNGLDRPNRSYVDPLGLGLEIETGGHVFSLNFQNAPYILETNYIPYTTESWGEGQIRFGFSISRNFYLGPRDGLANNEITNN